MEYGPRSLGNRSILYHAKDTNVNDWLNKRLKRTEFMTFAPSSLFEKYTELYVGLEKSEEAEKFMTISCPVTDKMAEACPAAVHVDGTARPQLVDSERNPSFHKILIEYEKLSGIGCVINTSFNMHEEPIVCTPNDAVRVFLDGKLDYLAIGNYIVQSKQ